MRKIISNIMAVINILLLKVEFCVNYHRPVFKEAGFFAFNSWLYVVLGH